MVPLLYVMMEFKGVAAVGTMVSGAVLVSLKT